MPADSATIPLWDAWGLTLDNGPNAPAALGEPRFYRGQTAGTPAPGYVLFGQVIAPAGGYYNGELGEVLRGMLHCWGRTPDEAEAIYRWVRGLLHDVPLAVQGFGTVAGTVGKTGPVPDQTGSAWQVIATYDAEPIQQAA